MSKKVFAGLAAVAIFAAIGLTVKISGPASPAYATEKKSLNNGNTYVGSEVCKTCHLEHHDAWKKTLHSRMLVDATVNQDAIVANLNPEKIRADLKKIEKLKVPADQIYIPKKEEIKYTIGSAWKQRYIVERNGKYFIAPVQYNVDSGRWVNYNEGDWEKRPWMEGCAGCHATGVSLEKSKFVEPGVGCEACHGPGSVHAALPPKAIYEKRATIINPAKLTEGVAVQICGSCHNRGKSMKDPKVGWPLGYLPGKALEDFYTSTSYASGDDTHVYPDEQSKAHHQQYIDWKQSTHADERVTCITCHSTHKLDGSSRTTTHQTEKAGSEQCLTCHTPINRTMAHSIHSFSNCVGCHMAKIVTSAESGDLHSHTFKALLPKETLANKANPNSCQGCHRHKNEDLAALQARYDALVTMPAPPAPACWHGW